MVQLKFGFMFSGVTTVLTLTTLRQSVRDELPTVEYSTALDVFLFVSFGFVLAALVEYIIIHFYNLSRRKVLLFNSGISNYESKKLTLYFFRQGVQKLKRGLTSL